MEKVIPQSGVIFSLYFFHYIKDCKVIQIIHEEKTHTCCIACRNP